MVHDKPREFVKEDLFKRTDLSLGIVNLISQRWADESIFIGINGPWDEGKTTVLNFAAESLIQNHSSSIIVVRFNPWMFGDENKLLTTFFATISKAIQLSQRKEHARTYDDREKVSRSFFISR